MVECENDDDHVYGHSGSWDRLIWGKCDEKRAIEDGQLDEPYVDTIGYFPFDYCPKCGIKLER